MARKSCKFLALLPAGNRGLERAGRIVFYHAIVRDLCACFRLYSTCLGLAGIQELN